MTNPMARYGGGLAGRAQLLRMRTLRALGDTAGARATAAFAIQALENGMGRSHPNTLAARALLDSLSQH